MKPAAYMQPQLAALLDKQALRELLINYCHAIDRLDWPALLGLFHPDATIDSGVIRGDPRHFVREFKRWVRKHGRLMFHTVANERVRIRGRHATGQCYVIAISRVRTPGGERDLLTVGRYLDRFERRAGEWKFLKRRFVPHHCIAWQEANGALPGPDVDRD